MTYSDIVNCFGIMTYFFKNGSGVATNIGRVNYAVLRIKWFQEFAGIMNCLVL